MALKRVYSRTSVRYGAPVRSTDSGLDDLKEITKLFLLSQCQASFLHIHWLWTGFPRDKRNNRPQWSPNCMTISILSLFVLYSTVRVAGSTKKAVADS